MHIGFYSPAWPPQGVANGIVTYVSQMRAALSARGHKVSIVAPNVNVMPDGEVVETDWSDPLIRRMSRRLAALTTRRPAELPAIGPAIARAFQQIHAALPLDVVEMEESFGWSGVVQDLLGLPVVVRLHGPHFLGQCEVETAAAAKLSALREHAEGDAIRRARYLTSPSATLLAATVKEYGSKAIATGFIPNPVSCPPPERCWTRDLCDPNMVLCVGRFDRRKGADVAIQAFVQVLERKPNARLAMVGPDAGVQIGNLHLNFAEYCRSHVPERHRQQIVHLGTLAPPEVEELRRRAFLTLVCSRFENFPYAVAEAMSLGCAVIATRSFGNAEMLEHERSGWLVDVDAPDQVAQAILAAFDDPDQVATVGQAARERCLERYAATVIAEETEDFYARALR